VFSSNAHPLAIPPGKTCGCYSKFSAYALLNHNGDFKAAAKELRSQGYGDQSSAPIGADATAVVAADIIIEHFRQVYQPVHRVEDAMYSGSFGRVVKPREALRGADKELVEKLMQAADVQHNIDGVPVRSSIPALFRKWAPTAWCELLKDLPEQETSSEVNDLAREQFRTELAKAMKRPITLQVGGKDAEDHREDHRESRPVIAWCAMFGKGPRWADVRGRDVWACTTNGRLRVAVRVELFSQVGVSGFLCGLTPRKFSELCMLYDCGKPIKVIGGDKRAVELDPDFLADLMASPEDPDGRTDTGLAPARARVESASVRPPEHLSRTCAGT
jgi:hypothetical protein